ncbi:MAG: hypothetical protein KGJ07_01980, partial [Patescibacteria group bacterium]|nr:hypothetical protein [Patescibacteria group bacterium]
LKGKPKYEDTFQSFALSWDFRVDPDNGDTGIVIQRHSDLPYLLGAVGVGIIFLALFGWFVKSQIIDSEDKKTK